MVDLLNEAYVSQTIIYSPKTARGGAGVTKTAKSYEQECKEGGYVIPEGASVFQKSDVLIYAFGGCNYKQMKSASLSHKLFKVHMNFAPDVPLIEFVYMLSDSAGKRSQEG